MAQSQLQQEPLVEAELRFWLGMLYIWQGKYNLAIDFFQTSDLKIEVLDLSGKVVFLSDHRSVMNFKGQLDISHLPGGIYILRLTSEEKSIFKKLVKSATVVLEP